jgi:2-polyprenyl-6-methoxyphenol hydroxylase-like FAD-dependent oxidoreductase
VVQNTDFDVAVVGYGPTGELLAILLAQLGYRVGVFERWPSIYELPRAVHFDDEVGRIFQAAGVREEILAITDPVLDFYEWRNRQGDALLKIDWARPGVQGWPTANFFTQPDLQRVLDRRVRQFSSVEVHTGWEATSYEERGDYVVLSVERSKPDAAGTRAPTREARQVTARYLIGADGANSRIRHLMGTAFHDLGFVPFDWLIVDVIPHDQERVWSPMNWQLCDPTRPTTVVSGGPGRRRWEFMCLPGEPIEKLNTEETAWRLLQPWGMNPETAELERHAVYRFMARYAEDWRQGRVLLAGDAAHLMPPFAGEGMCNGLRDVMNITWKLDLILSGKAPAVLLDLYQTERIDHVRQWIKFSAALGEVICVLDEGQAEARDARMLAGDADPGRVLPAAPPQRLSAGLFRQDHPAAGVHFIQAPIEYEGRRGLFDDLVGVGFAVLGADQHTLDGIDEIQQSALAGIGARILNLGGASDREGTIDDPSGAYRRWFEENDCVAVLVRPDFYVYGVASKPGDVPALIGSLIGDLGLGSINMQISHSGG